MLEALSCIPVLQKAGSVVQAYSLSIWEVGAEGLAVQSYSLISGEFKTWLDHIRSYLKQNKIIFIFPSFLALLSCDITRLFLISFPL